MGWSEWAPNLTIHKVPGTHDDLMEEPNVDKLVKSLKREIDHVEHQSA